MDKKQSDKRGGLALPLRALEVGTPGGFQLGWCAVDADDRVIGYCMTEEQAKQLVAPFAESHAPRKHHDSDLEEALTGLVSTPSATPRTMADEWIERALDLEYHGQHRDAYRQGQYDARFHVDRVLAYSDYDQRQEYMRGYRNGAVRQFVIEMKDRAKRPANNSPDGGKV